MECALCTAQEEGYRIVYKDEYVVVMVVREPMKLGHVMVLPIRHVREVGELTPVESVAFLRTVDACMHLIEQEFEDGPMCFLNGWKFRTQEHVHVHVLPCKEGQRELVATNEGIDPRPVVSHETLANMADQMRPLFKLES
ncbi:MAG: HIT family protein [Patescibacteria group bacterium]